MPGGVVHNLPADLHEALIANPTALAACGRTSRPWPATSSSAGSRTPSKRRHEAAAFAGPRKSWRKASAGPAAGLGASTARAPGGERSFEKREAPRPAGRGASFPDRVSEATYECVAPFVAAPFEAGAVVSRRPAPSCVVVAKRRAGAGLRRRSLGPASLPASPERSPRPPSGQRAPPCPSSSSGDSSRPAGGGG